MNEIAKRKQKKQMKRNSCFRNDRRRENKQIICFQGQIPISLNQKSYSLLDTQLNFLEELTVVYLVSSSSHTTLRLITTPI
jgi:hypothetical protein